MRGNGLQAQSYVAVADLDRRTADFLLAELRARGVAAYAADSPEPGPSGPVDRLYVDAEAETEVRGMIDEQLEPPGEDEPAADATPDNGGRGRHGDGLDSDYVDSTFADIVAGFHQGSGSEVGRWSAEEDTEDPADTQDAGGRADAAGTPPASSSGAVPSYIGWDDLLRPEPPAPDPLPDPEDRYVPPPPPPLPRGSRRTRAAWAAVLGGPAVLFAAAIFGLHLDNTVLFLCAVAFLGGFAGLVAGLRSDSDDDEDDDGAVV